MMGTRLILGALSLLVFLVGLPACGGIQPTVTPAEQPAEIVVSETIAVTEDMQVLPPVVISTGETITLSDAVQVFPQTAATRTPAVTPTPVEKNPDLAISKFLNSAFHYGQLGSYTILVTNVGGGTASSPITVVDNLPDGFTFDSYSDPYSTSWACSASGQQVTCTYKGSAIAPGGSLPTLILNVSIAPIDQFPGVANAVDNCSQVQHPDDLNPENDKGCVSTVASPSGAAG